MAHGRNETGIFPTLPREKMLFTAQDQTIGPFQVPIRSLGSDQPLGEWSAAPHPAVGEKQRSLRGFTVPTAVISSGCGWAFQGCRSPVGADETSLSLPNALTDLGYAVKTTKSIRDAVERPTPTPDVTFRDCDITALPKQAMAQERKGIKNRKRDNRENQVSTGLFPVPERSGGSL
ncbi:hypothetical protein AAFF_G00307350 [Aldrovandia affinis]|uniref:Uncharacterized protein n=1 Tax=Aldrovandia affinis TaxID=143900 RepID=A0AAD7W0Z1_9TELE|nr:hypothetical protein AAFF_G00307350 [Aldrovandia affinis]